MPDVAVLFAEVLERQNQVEEAREAYTYTKVATDLEPDGRGGVVEKAVRSYEVFSVGGRRFEKLVARDGRPLPAGEARKEEQRIEKQVRRHRAKLAERAAGRSVGGRRSSTTSSHAPESALADAWSRGSASWWEPSGSTRTPGASCGWTPAWARA
jgi:hypothetical protein